MLVLENLQAFTFQAFIGVCPTAFFFFGAGELTQITVMRMRTKRNKKLPTIKRTKSHAKNEKQL